MKKLMFFMLIIVMPSIACITGTPSESIRRYVEQTQTAEAVVTSVTTTSIQCPPLGEYRILTEANVEIAGELAALLSYENRRVSVESRLGFWSSDRLPDGPVRFEMTLSLEDGRRYHGWINGVICPSGDLYIQPPEIKPAT